jgi:single-strand DNA-binding protein
MPNLNKVMLMGNLTRDPELRYTPNNTAVANLGMAINRTWFNKQTNEKQEETTFVDLEAWGRTAEVLNQYLKKGRPLYVEGRLKLDQWQDKESGANRSKLKIVVETFEFLDSRTGGGGEDSGGGYPQQGGRASGGARSAPAPASAAPASAAPAHQPVDEDDIPF